MRWQCNNSVTRLTEHFLFSFPQHHDEPSYSTRDTTSRKWKICEACFIGGEWFGRIRGVSQYRWIWGRKSFSPFIEQPRHRTVSLAYRIWNPKFVQRMRSVEPPDSQVNHHLIIRLRTPFRLSLSLGIAEGSSFDSNTMSGMKQGVESEVERRRARGQLSCAECRRLKLKCDKKVPCSSCKRRRCEGICPNGVLKSVYASKQEMLHQRLSSMNRRIRQLEDALQAERSSNATLPPVHPLLTDELLAVKNTTFLFEDTLSEKDPSSSSLVDSNSQKNEADGEEEEEVVTSLGFLSISEEGEAQYVGQSGFHQIAFLTEEQNARDASQSSQSKAFDATFSPKFNHSWPFAPLRSSSPKVVQDSQDLLETQLPECGRAILLVDRFLMNHSWAFCPAGREQLVDDLIHRAYRHGLDENPGSGPDVKNGHIDPHDLALLFMVFSCGARVQSALDAMENRESALYHELACTSLGLKSAFHNTSLLTIQAISLMSMSEIMMKNNLDSAWKMCSLTLACAVSIGLHRDPARWRIEQKLIQRRRLLFWEVYMNCCWMGICSGRPIIFAPDVVDCGFPEDPGSRITEDGTVVPGITRWKHKFARDVIAHIAQRLCTSRPLKYSDILELDRRIQEFDKVPTPFPRSNLPLGLAHDAPSEAMHRLDVLMFKDMGIMYIHRALFARALLDFPEDPLRSPFAPSFVAAYRSATNLLKVIRENYDNYPHVFMRGWVLWVHAFSSAIIIGSIVSRAPSSELATGAFFELGYVIAIFTKAQTNPVVKQGLPILLRVYNKAYHAFHDRPPSLNSMTSSTPTEGRVDDDNELDLLSGVTRTITKKSLRLRDMENSSSKNTVASNIQNSAPSIPNAGSLQSGSAQYPNHIQQSVDAKVGQSKRDTGVPQRIIDPSGKPLRDSYPEYADIPTERASEVGNAWSMDRANPSIYFPAGLYCETSFALPFEGMPTLENATFPNLSAYPEMNIDVSDVNFDLSSLLSSNGSTPSGRPSTTNIPASTDGFGILPATPPPFPNNNDSSQGSSQKPLSAEVPHPGDDLEEAWRSMYTRAGLTPNAMQSLTGDHNAPREGSAYGFMGAGPL